MILWQCLIMLQHGITEHMVVEADSADDARAIALSEALADGLTVLRIITSPIG